MTCNDLRFPELAPAPAAAGAAGSARRVRGIHKTEQWLALKAERSIENSVYVAGVRQAQPVSLG